MTIVVLVVEGDATLRAFLGDVLRGEGYHVIEATDAQHACKTLHDMHCGLDVLLTDVEMPGDMSGLDLAQHAQEACPEASLLVMSGACVDRKLLPKKAAFFQKPFSTGLLLRCIEQAGRPHRH